MTDPLANFTYADMLEMMEEERKRRARKELENPYLYDIPELPERDKTPEEIEEEERIDRIIQEREIKLMPFKKRALKELYQLGDEKNVDVSHIDLSTPYDDIVVTINELCREDGYHFLNPPKFIEIMARIRATDENEVKKVTGEFQQLEKDGLDW